MAHETRRIEGALWQPSSTTNLLGNSRPFSWDWNQTEAIGSLAREAASVRLAVINFDVYVIKMNHKLRNCIRFTSDWYQEMDIERQIHFYSYPFEHLLNPVDFVQPYSETRLTVEEYAILQQSQYTDSIDSVVSQEWSETARRQQQRYT